MFCEIVQTSETLLSEEFYVTQMLLNVQILYWWAGVLTNSFNNCKNMMTFIKFEFIYCILESGKKVCLVPC